MLISLYICKFFETEEIYSLLMFISPLAFVRFFSYTVSNSFAEVNMKIIVTTGSATYAQKASRVLNDINIKNRIVRSTSPLNEGCGYGIEVQSEDSEKITEILHNAGVRISEVKAVK